MTPAARLPIDYGSSFISRWPYLFRLFLPVTALLLGGCFLSRLHPSTNQDAGISAASGFWQDPAKHDYYISLEGGILTISYNERVQEVGTILDATAERIKVCRFGRESTFLWRKEGNSLIFRDTSLQETHRMIRLQNKPAALELESFHLPPRIALSEARINRIQKELYQRQQKDQQILRASYHHEAPDSKAPLWMRTRSEQGAEALSDQTDLRFAAIVTENTEYIRKLLAEVGWIDAERFGYSTSNSAFLLVQHSWEPPLMIAVLPQLKQDVDAGRMDAGTYALLFDRLQLSLGKRQRFGSQVATDQRGEIFVLPVEDPPKVDALRASLGLMPLKEYVQVFGASDVKFSQDCQELTSVTSALSR